MKLQAVFMSLAVVTAPASLVVPPGPAWAEVGGPASPHPLCVVFDEGRPGPQRCADRLDYCLPGEAAATPHRAAKTPPPPAAVVFAPPAADDLDARIVAEQLILQKTSRRNGDKPSPEVVKDSCDGLGLYRYDLDGDKTEELFVSLDSSGWCGSGGCFATVFRRTGDGWVQLGAEFFSRGLRIEKAKHDGFRDLSYSANGMRARLKWNGERYEEE